MKRPRLVSATAWTLVGMFLASHALACGDKFLVVGRSVRSQRARGAVHKAAILMYLDPQSGLPDAMREEHFEQDLKLAGHSIQSVPSRERIAEALKAARYDLVVVGVADMPALEALVASVASRPTLLPIIYNPTGEELEAAKKQFSCVMKSPSTRQDFLMVIEDAMAQRKTSAERQ